MEIRLILGENTYPLDQTFKQQRNTLKGMRERKSIQALCPFLAKKTS